MTYSCDAGFVLFEDATVECLASANWSTLPFCSGERESFFIFLKLDPDIAKLLVLFVHW